MWNVPLFPERASSNAASVDAIYLAWVLLGGAVSFIVALLLIHYAIRYRAGAKVDRTPSGKSTTRLEVAWIISLTVIFLLMFAWGAYLYFSVQRPPQNTLDIYVVGKQWMWKAQHPGGQREINELHVPVNQPIKLIVTTQDVIHSFYIPAFRVKQDAVPGRYSTLWFTPTRVGEYHLFCAEYCGAGHSAMVGRVVVMERADYERWLSARSEEPAIPGEPGTVVGALAAAGKGPYFQHGCNACHVPESALRAPRLEGIYGRQIKLRNGEVIVADEQYLRESIIEPNAKIVAGYPSPSLMPSYRGQLDDEQMSALIEYLKSLTPKSSGEYAP